MMYTGQTTSTRLGPCPYCGGYQCCGGWHGTASTTSTSTTFTITSNIGQNVYASPFGDAIERFSRAVEDVGTPGGHACGHRLFQLPLSWSAEVEDRHDGRPSILARISRRPARLAVVGAPRPRKPRRRRLRVWERAA